MSSTARTIDKDRIDQWLAQLLEQAEVIAPTTAFGDDVIYQPVSSADQVLWQFGNSLHPPKQFVLPQTDPIVSIRPTDTGIQVAPIYDARPRILLNLRSCDAKGIAFLTKMHASDLVDDSYMKRIEQITVITLACTQPDPLCFCACTDSGPFARQGSDLQLTDLGSHLLAEPYSDKGRALVDRAEALFQPATDDDLAERQRLEELAMRRFGDQTCHFGAAMRRLSVGRVPDKFWSDTSDWCLGCGGCTMVCPTCYCFSVKDRTQPEGWTRCRTWDSCQYAAFTLEASGHNPRANRKDRMKRRFFHKVSAQYYRRDGMVGCVGCGRCIQVCLGTADMPAVVTAMRKGAWHG